MKRTTGLLIVMGLATAGVWISGCDDDNGSMMGRNNNASPYVVRISPPDGATSVATTALIGIKFNLPMDTTSVMAGFHFSGGSPMRDWMDTLELHGSIGMMNMNHMMNWMDSIEQHGRFHWNAARDSCEFIPDSLLAPNTEHMVFMYGAVRSHSGMMMDMNQFQYDGYMNHFQTGP